MRRTNRLVAVLAASTAFLVGGAAAWAAADITANGGARRLAGDQTQSLKQAIKSGDVRNVILLIGDGMGDSEITIARNYQYGAAGRLPGIDALPLTGSYTTYALWAKGTPYAGKPDYVTDSAASGTGWATGTKTYNNAISVNLDGVPQQTILELAKANGLRTGNVTTAEIQDATPAVLASHVVSRSCYSPSRMSQACKDSGLPPITEQFITTRADVTLGGGLQYFQEHVDGTATGPTFLDEATDAGYQIVTTKDELAAVTQANEDKPLLGLFAPGNLPVNWVGPAAAHYATNADVPAPVACAPNPALPASQPDLGTMTTKAISLLDVRKSRGFFLQVEGASVDKQDHEANACGQIGETIDLDEAVQVALNFARKDGHTLVVVTADHGHTSQIVYPNTTTPGAVVNLLTADGAPMTVNYATQPVGPGTSQDHTGTQVRIAAYGPGAANVVGLTDQTDLFFTMKSLLRLDERKPTPPWHGTGWGWPWNWQHRH